MQGSDHSLSMVQSLLMLDICTILSTGGEESAVSFEIHHRVVSLSRSGGLTSTSSRDPSQAEDLDALWRQFAQAEALKRTLLVAHQTDALWYQFLSIPRSMSHLEIKHDLPCSTQLWEAPSAERWAHRQFTTCYSGEPVLYGEAVRRFLAPDGAVETLPDFEPCWHDKHRAVSAFKCARTVWVGNNDGQTELRKAASDTIPLAGARAVRTASANGQQPRANALLSSYLGDGHDRAASLVALAHMRRRACEYERLRGTCNIRSRVLRVPFRH